MKKLLAIIFTIVSLSVSGQTLLHEIDSVVRKQAASQARLSNVLDHLVDSLRTKSLTVTSPITKTGSAIGINDAVANGTGKGAATFTASDFNSSGGVISIDYTNAQKSTSSQPGLLTSTDWNTFNNKQNAGVGSNNQIIENISGSLSGSSSLTYDPTNNIYNAGNLTQIGSGSRANNFYSGKDHIDSVGTGSNLGWLFINGEGHHVNIQSTSTLNDSYFYGGFNNSIRINNSQAYNSGIIGGQGNYIKATSSSFIGTSGIYSSINGRIIINAATKKALGILGGEKNIVTGNHSWAIGGYGQTVTDSATVGLPSLQLSNVPINNDTIVHILVRDNSTGKTKTRRASSFISKLTTTGTSGAATLSNGTLNIPQYSTTGGSSTSFENNTAWYKASNVKSLPAYFVQSSGGSTSSSGSPWQNSNGIKTFRVLGIGDSEMDDYWIYQAPFENILGRKYNFSGPGLLTFGQGGNNNGISALNYSSLHWTLNDQTTGGRGIDAYSLISTSISSDLVYTQTPSLLNHNKWTSVRVFWYGKSGGGTFTITVDSGSPTSVNTSSLTGVQYTEITGLSDATHTLTIHRSSGGTAEIELLGFQLSRSTPGLQFNKAGHLGLKATDYAAQDSATKVAEYRAVRPNMVIINYTNDLAKSGDTTAYKNAIKKIIRWVKASDNLCSIAVIGPMPVNVAFWHPSFSISAYERQLIQIASSDSVGVLLQSKLWGTQEKSYSRGVYIDSTHLNPYGGSALMATILEPFGASYLSQGFVTTMQQIFDSESLHKSTLISKDTLNTGGNDFVIDAVPNLFIKNSSRGVNIHETGTSTTVSGVNRGVNDSFVISGYGGNFNFGSVFSVTAATGQLTAGNSTVGSTFIMSGSGNGLQKFLPSSSDTWFQRSLFSTSGFRWEGGNLTDLDGHNSSYFGAGIIKDYRGTNLPIFFSTEGTTGGTVYSNGVSTHGTFMVGKGTIANSSDLNKSYMQISGGTTSQASIIFLSGTLTSSINAGQMEYDGSNFYLSPSTTRKRVALTNNLTPSNGQIPIGNGTDYTAANITSSSASIIVTNGSGTITLSSGNLSNTTTLDFGSTSAQTSTDLTITVTGALVGDAVSLGTDNASIVPNSSYTAWVSSTNTVTVRFNNYSSGTQDPSSGTFKVIVMK